jgi:tRNA (guanine-N7-)-methyltransferase
MASPAEYSANRTYGRRKGHALSPRKQRLMDELLPTLRLDLGAPPPRPLTDLFAAPVSQVWLEVGFGAGEHLLWQAERNPRAGIVGCEPYVNGVAALLGAMDGRRLPNVRVWDGDAREVIDWLDHGSLTKVFVLHPDPWPKARHRKRRFISPGTLDVLARAMRPGAELRIATDIGDYVRSSLEAVRAGGHFEWLAERPADWRERPADWPRTRYEKKALREGRPASYLRFARR